jgi:hypothetical protein
MHSHHIDEIVRSFGYLLNPGSRARDGASACTVSDTPFDIDAILYGWRNGPEDTRPDTPRSTALLAAYAMIFGNGIRPDGLPTSDGRWFRPDKSVVRACIRSGDMKLQPDQLLSLTDKAYERISLSLSRLSQK